MKKLFLKTMLLLCALVVGSSSLWAEEQAYKTLTFTSNNNTKVGSYTDSWTETVGESSWTIENFNNNNWGWTDNNLKVIKCGRKKASGKNTPSVATITTDAAIDQAITKVVVKLTAISSGDYNSIKLYVASNAAFTEDLTTVNVSPIPTAAGDMTITVPAADRAANRFYKLEFDTKGSTSSNGHTGVTKVEYFYDYTPSATLESITLTGTYPTEFYVGDEFSHEGMTVTANYDDNTHVDVTGSATFTGYDMDTASDQTVTVSYGGKSATYDITVNAIPTKSIVDFIAEASAATGKKCRCYLMGKVSNIASTKYGNFTLTDNSGSIYIYGTLTPAKETQKFSTLGVEEGDYVKVLAEQYVLYNETDEASNVVFVKEMGKETTPAVSDAGWATYVTVNPVRFANGDAFVVASASDKVYMESATDVPANTPVVLKGAGVKTAMVLDDAPAAPANELAISNGGSIDGFVLAKKNDVVGFYKWNGGSLTSGKVYLPTSAVSSAREFIGFDGDVTGINNVKSEKIVNGIFDLQGRKVVTPSKGLYIVNGKKVVIK